MINKEDLLQALHILDRAAKSRKGRKAVAALLYRTDRTGHSRLCRILNTFAHCGPHGTFVKTATLKLDTGGHLCSFGIDCGEPTDSYMQQMRERMEEFQRIQQILEKSGALVSMVWKNPRFSAAGLCKCGHADDPAFPHHDPLCPYRTEHDIKVTVEEYRVM